MYFEETVHTNFRQPNRYDDGGEMGIDGRLPLFCHPGRPTTMLKGRYSMKDKEWETAHMCILCNTPEINTILEEYHDMIDEFHPDKTANERDEIVNSNFTTYFTNYVRNYPDANQRLITLAIGPRKEITRYKGYYTNG